MRDVIIEKPLRIMNCFVNIPNMKLNTNQNAKMNMNMTMSENVNENVHNHSRKFVKNDQ